MDGINLGATIARERRAADVTQGELAAHLGVTKAAVSKWELGQSMPDVALLPRIAAYFGLTLDELFDYRPQLSAEEVRDAYLRLAMLIDEDPDAALEEVERLIADYYSCWPLLHQMGTLLMQRAAFDPERGERLLSRSVELLARVEENSDDVALVGAARMMRASAMNLQGDLDGCVALLESLKPDRVQGVDLALAALYEQRGEREASLRLYQASMGWGVMSAMSSVSAQLLLYADDDAHREALVRAGEGLLVGFDLEDENPMAALTFLANASAACLVGGDGERAEAYLGRFVRLLERLDDRALLYGAGESVLYDLVPELAAPSGDEGEAAAAYLGALDMRRQCAQLVMARPEWAERADDARFQPLLARLEAL
ncbi:helix-turn-helix domain-containing protein [Arabiibacter massiliensis]|uniref:helix-turn-helix domain-containing protein n=1 Tax=Arabiibacter massiliensis TaxID=1870985 RepID=UPI0009BBE698|nr:helix-turn-helix transcriptional regulator [Arabiibacter massiliensis]